MSSTRKKNSFSSSSFKNQAIASQVSVPEAIVIADDDAYLKTSAANTPSNVPIEVARSPTNNRSGGITPTDLLRLKSYPFPEANEQNVKAFLDNYNWPPGLQQALLKSVVKIPIRFFLVDDSGSMLSNDGKKRIFKGDKSKVISCTRWSELTDALTFHAGLSHAANATSEFRFINQRNPIIIGREDDRGERLEVLEELFEQGPAGQTPLCFHIRAIIDDITRLAPQLNDQNQKVVVIICTDGESTDGDIADAMKPLQDLPVLVVVRLCTDEDDIVQYWNSIDEKLEVDIDVLDDLRAEALEVKAVNGWLTYGEPLHRLREFGCILKECDLIDESLITSEQMKVMICFLIGDGNVRRFPCPDLNWSEFQQKITEASGTDIGRIFDPITNDKKPWVNLSMICKLYGYKNTSSSCIVS